jgi:hypothetical protein
MAKRARMGVQHIENCAHLPKPQRLLHTPLSAGVIRTQTEIMVLLQG